MMIILSLILLQLIIIILSDSQNGLLIDLPALTGPIGIRTRPVVALIVPINNNLLLANDDQLIGNVALAADQVLCVHVSELLSEEESDLRLFLVYSFDDVH